LADFIVVSYSKCLPLQRLVICRSSDVEVFKMIKLDCLSNIATINYIVATKLGFDLPVHYYELNNNCKKMNAQV
jgi:hypothetical protein